MRRELNYTFEPTPNGRGGWLYGSDYDNSEFLSEDIKSDWYEADGKVSWWIEVNRNPIENDHDYIYEYAIKLVVIPGIIINADFISNSGDDSKWINVLDSVWDHARVGYKSVDVYVIDDKYREYHFNYPAWYDEPYFHPQEEKYVIRNY